MKSKLNFLVEWSTIKERTWSGTVWGLSTSLSKHFSINEVNISLKPSLLSRILRKIRLIKGNLSIREILRERRRLRDSNLIDNRVASFQFAEVLDATCFPNNYIYQDLSVPYLKYLSETSPDIFAHSGFNMVGKAALSVRSKMQMEYYKTCKGIFTMGEWLRDDFINRLGIEPAKVHCVGGV